MCCVIFTVKTHIQYMSSLLTFIEVYCYCSYNSFAIEQKHFFVILYCKTIVSQKMSIKSQIIISLWLHYYIYISYGLICLYMKYMFNKTCFKKTVQLFLFPETFWNCRYNSFAPSPRYIVWVVYTYSHSRMWQTGSAVTT